jgi:hypothetical protein
MLSPPHPPPPSLQKAGLAWSGGGEGGDILI